MIRFFLTTVATVIMISGQCFGQPYQFQLNAGTTNVNGEFSAKHYLDTGFLKTGIGFIYADDDDEKYKMLDGTLAVGSESLYPGLKCELGFKGILGTAEDDDNDGDVGGVGFYGSGAYLLPERITPIPIEFVAGITGVPSPLAFLDLDHYLEFRLSVGFYIVENAAILLSYRHSRFAMDDDDDWDLNDDAFSIGLAINW